VNSNTINISQFKHCSNVYFLAQIVPHKASKQQQANGDLIQSKAFIFNIIQTSYHSMFYSVYVSKQRV